MKNPGPTPGTPAAHASRESPLTIDALIAQEGRLRPTQTAIASVDGDALSYSELAEAVTSIGEGLCRHGVLRTDRLAVVMNNGPDMAVAVLSSACAAVAAPMNPAGRYEEFQKDLHRIRATALVTQAGVNLPAVGAAMKLGLPIVELSSEGPPRVLDVQGVVASETIPDGSASPSDVALALHTSGSTAAPRCVPLTHENLCRSARNIRVSLDLEPSDRCLNIMPLFHVHGLVGALLSTLSAGSTIICSPGFNAEGFWKWLEELGPTWYTAVPTMHQAVLERRSVEGAEPVKSSLRFIRSCSSPLPPFVMGRLAERFGVPVTEAYGMTEASHQVSCNPLAGGPRKPGSVGLPTGPEVAILDGAGRRRDPGSVGEVVLQGDTVVVGYSDAKEANRTSFVDGWFRTGDEGYFDEDGYLFLTGRLKEIINRAGEKISPREVDEVLLEHPSVRQALAYPVPDPSLGEDVGAAVVLEAGAELDPHELRKFVARKLTDFKVPRTIRIVAEIPKGATGKPQRNKLAELLGDQAPDRSAVRPSRTNASPATTVEQMVAAIWRDVLGVDEVGLRESFLDLGGDSVVTTRMLLDVYDAWGVEVSLVDFLENPTVSGLSQILVAHEEKHGATNSLAFALVPIRERGTRPPLFCVPPHTDQLWELSQLFLRLDRDTPIYALRTCCAEALEPGYTVQKLAARNIELMRSVQAHGPFSLIGLCFGGVVIFEMARQLGELNEEVNLLALIESFNPAWFRSQGPSSPGDQAGDGVEEGGDEPPQSEDPILRANEQARIFYEPRQHAVPALIIRSDKPRPWAPLIPGMGWESVLAGGFEECRIEAERNNIMREPRVAQVAAAIDEARKGK